MTNEGSNLEDPDVAMVREAARWFEVEAALSARRDIPARARWPELIDEVVSRRFEAESGWELYRARTMALEDEDAADPLHVSVMGPPPLNAAKPGRLNAAGVACFYGARQSATAIAEARPWKRCRVTVVRCQTTVPLSLVDLSGEIVESNMSPTIDWLSFVLQRPVHPEDSESYLPSQALATECARRNISGVIYRSALHTGGTNVAILRPDFVRYGIRALFEVIGIEYTTAQMSDWE